MLPGLARYSTTRFYEVKGSVGLKCEIYEKYISGSMEYIQSALDTEIQKGEITREYAEQFKFSQEDAYKKAVSKSASCVLSVSDFEQHLTYYTQGYLYSDIPILLLFLKTMIRILQTAVVLCTTTNFFLATLWL